LFNGLREKELEREKEGLSRREEEEKRFADGGRRLSQARLRRSTIKRNVEF
jgi:hypothetical protein